MNLPPSSRNVDITLTNITLTGRQPTPRGRPDIPEPPYQHINSQQRIPICVRAFTVLLLYASGPSPYCCYMCLGFHRTAVICVWAFTVLLLYVSGLSPYCCYMCLGFHRTAVICVRAFTVLLLYVSGLSPYCCYMYLGFHCTAVLFLSELYTHMSPHGAL